MSIEKDTIYVIDVLHDPQIKASECFPELFQQENLDFKFEMIDGSVNFEIVQEIFSSKPLGIIISGSVHSVYEELDWMQNLEQAIQMAHKNETPVLGVCFGHQIIASALGGKVELMPNMREFGNFPIYLTNHAQEHPYLADFPSGTHTTLSHKDQVTELPPNSTHYGFSLLTQNQIFECGSCFGVQFHPEYHLTHLKLLSQRRKQLFLDEKLYHSSEHLEQIVSTFHMTPESRKIIVNFLKTVGALK